MPFYYKINEHLADDRRIAQKLLDLKAGIRKAKIPERSVEDSLMLATWNLREFGNSKYGLRDKEPLYYIAEIISAFDLVAVQEVRNDLSSLKSLMDILGSSWKYLITDVTIGSTGNGERMAFLYDTRKISFGGLAGEVVLPSDKKNLTDQLARTPFIVGFQAGWFKFTICVAHIYYGKGIAVDPRRKAEIENLSNFLAKRAEDKYAWSKNMILLGDFNIFNVNDVTMAAITKAGFVVPKKLQEIPGSNALKNKHYDQIAFITPDQKQLEFCEAGIFDYFEYVYRTEDQQLYTGKFPDVTVRPDELDSKGSLNKYKTWRTFQMSDHLPMWIELKIDFGIEYLKRKTILPE